NGLGIITSPNLQGSSGSLVCGAGGAGISSPPPRAATFRPAALPGLVRSVAKRRDLENERGDRKRVRTSAHCVRVTCRYSKVDGPRRIQARPQPQGESASRARKNRLQISACQRHFCLPPGLRARPPRADIPQPDCSRQRCFPLLTATKLYEKPSAW